MTDRARYLVVILLMLGIAGVQVVYAAVNTDWSLAALKEHFDSKVADAQARCASDLKAAQEANNQRFAGSEKAVADALAAAEKAVIKAESASEKRFESVNEFRNTLKDQAATFITRTEVESRLTGLDQRIAKLDTETSAHIASQAGSGAVTGVLWGGAIATAVVVVGGVILSMLRKREKSGGM